FALVSPAAIVAELGRMKVDPSTKVDSGIARQIAQRQGIKAIVDGDVTAVGGGYIVAIRLVRADSGVELASFRESGDGPRGLIDAADRLARALRSKAGESLRSVNATPPLAQATTTSLEALRKYSEASRLNTLGDVRSITLSREAVALDSTFASAWSGLAAELNNYNGLHSSIDSATTQAYRYRDKLPANERDGVTGRYFALGPGRDRTKAIAAYEEVLKRTTGLGNVQVNVGEILRSRREYARAESLNVVATALQPRAATALGNTVEIQLDQGKLKEAAATVDRLRANAMGYGNNRNMYVLWAKGDFPALRAINDTMSRAKMDSSRGPVGILIARALALRDGRVREDQRWRAVWVAQGFRTRPDDAVTDVFLELVELGTSPALVSKLDDAIAKVPFRDLPQVDRPYFTAAYALAISGQAAKARAMIARYHAEVTDTSIIRAQEADLHTVLGEIALADKKPQEAITEFKRGDIAYDGAPANECAPCLSVFLARAYDAAGKADSAAMMFERYLATPYWNKPDLRLDPV
ncbi:MAG TPA: hypothetical protein VGN65_03940, partial [Casimicrobiaceae bacterium]